MNLASKTSPLTEKLQIPCNHTSSVELQSIIGTGTFGTVWIGNIVRKSRPAPHRLIETKAISCKRPQQVKHYAIKCTNTNQSQIFENIARNEIRVLMLCRGLDCIVQIQFTHETSHSIYIGMDYCSGADFHTVLSTTGMSHHHILVCLAEVATALNHLHRRKIIYRDLKLENLCFDSTGHLKLVDFGLAYILEEKDYNPVSKRYEVISSSGTMGYTAPEVYERKPHGFEVDWWSYGIVTYEILSGATPFNHDNVSPQENHVNFHRNAFISHGSVAEHFVSMFLQKNQEKRFGFFCEDMLFIARHPFFMAIDWHLILTRSHPLHEKGS